MTPRLLLLLPISFLIAAEEPPKEIVLKELKKLEGEWQVVAVERDERKSPAANFQDERVTIDGDQWIVKKAGKIVQRATLSIDPTTKPKTFVKTITEGVNKGARHHGIYELDGETLRECRAPADKERPKEFSSKGAAILVYKRVK
jgi:uncharacterized protein (TIGR03067 family)